MGRDKATTAHKNKKSSRNMVQTRQHDNSNLKRNTANSASRNIFANDLQKKKKRKKNSSNSTKNKKNKNHSEPSKNKQSKDDDDVEEQLNDQDSGTSQSDNNEDNEDDESEDDDDDDDDDDEDNNKTETKIYKQEKSNQRSETVDINNKNTNNEGSSDSDESSNSEEGKKYNDSALNPSAKTALQFYVRTSLFSKIKIIGNEHLEFNGPIIREAIQKAGFDAKKDNLNAFVNSCRKLIKRTISSKRSYIKKEIGEMFIGKLTRIFKSCKWIV
jgi:hypothetical protein